MGPNSSQVPSAGKAGQKPAGGWVETGLSELLEFTLTPTGVTAWRFLGGAELRAGRDADTAESGQARHARWRCDEAVTGGADMEQRLGFSA